MWDALFWLYLINATLIITHEIDSAYWKEWELFRLPGGIGGFLVIHLPLVLLILWGTTRVAARAPSGLVLSAVLAAAGIIAFGLHAFFLLRGRSEFRTPISMALLTATLVVSAAQLIVCIRLW